MGDIIHAMVVLQFIKKQLPNVSIDWIVEESFKGVLQNNPHIDNILSVDLKSIKKQTSLIFDQYNLLKQYAKNNYDVVIDAQGLIKSAIVSKIVGNRVVGSFISGFDKDSIRESFASFFYDKKVFIPYEKNVIDRNIKLIAKSLDIEISLDQLMQKQPFLYTNATFDQNDYIVFVVGASKPNKIYPKQKFLELAQRLEEKVIVVWGNDSEKEIALWLEQNDQNIKAALKGDLEQLKAIIKNSKLVVGGDTGPTHMAWAMNIPSITIFGNTPEYRNTYITNINKVIKSDSIVDPLKLDKNDFSIENIKASSVASLAKELLA